MAKIKQFFQRKDVILSGKRYGIDALGAMAQGLFCTLLVGTILNTLGQQFHEVSISELLTSVKDSQSITATSPFSRSF